MDLVYPGNSRLRQKETKPSIKGPIQHKEGIRAKRINKPNRVDYRGKVKFPGGTLE